MEDTQSGAPAAADHGVQPQGGQQASVAETVTDPNALKAQAAADGATAIAEVIAKMPPSMEDRVAKLESTVAFLREHLGPHGIVVPE
jgi:hypothetical protein